MNFYHAVFEQVTKNAVLAIWAQRSKLNLVGAHINVFTGEWTQKVHNAFLFVESYTIKSLKEHTHTHRYNILNILCFVAFFPSIICSELVFKIMEPCIIYRMLCPTLFSNYSASIHTHVLSTCIPCKLC